MIATPIYNTPFRLKVKSTKESVCEESGCLFVEKLMHAFQRGVCITSRGTEIESVPVTRPVFELW